LAGGPPDPAEVEVRVVHDSGPSTAWSGPSGDPSGATSSTSATPEDNVDQREEMNAIPA
jgi:hypothetical protein